MPKTKANVAEMTKRINVCFELLINGARREQVYKHIAEKHSDWKVNSRQIDVYIKRASAAIVKEGDLYRDEERSKSLLRLDDIYAKAMRNQDHARALAANDQRNKILGLYAPQQVEVVHLLDDNKASVEQLSIMFELARKRGAIGGELIKAMIDTLARQPENAPTAKILALPNGKAQ